MKLYYTKGACSLVVRITINELGLTSEYESVDLKDKKTESGKNYLEINPKGAVPALQTGNGEILTENAVILQYLADTTNATQLLPQIGDFKRYRVLEWLNYITTELHKGFGPLFNPALPQEIKEQFFIPMLQKKLSYVNDNFGGTYLMGDSYMLPDAYLYVMLRWAQAFKFDLSKWPKLVGFFNMINDRPSVQKSLQEEGL